MATHRYLALLRGINVGGKNLIGKDDLKRCFERLGMTHVRTYIQSGNILFRSEATSLKELTQSVVAGLAAQFQYDAQAVVLSHRKYQQAMAAAPSSWGTADDHKHNAVFTLPGITPKQVLRQLEPPKTDIEQVTVGPGVLLWSISRSRENQTTYQRLPQSSIYRQVTIRNHNTSLKLLAMLEEL